MEIIDLISICRYHEKLGLFLHRYPCISNTWHNLEKIAQLYCVTWLKNVVHTEYA